MHISEIELSIQKKPWVFDIKMFEVVAEHFAYGGKNTRHRQSMC